MSIESFARTVTPGAVSDFLGGLALYGTVRLLPHLKRWWVRKFRRPVHPIGTAVQVDYRTYQTESRHTTRYRGYPWL